MAVADDRAPAVCADGENICVDDAPVRVRKIRHELAVAVAAARHGDVLRVIQPIAPEDVEHRLGRVTGRARRDCMGRQVFALRGPELDAMALAQPLRVARMVRAVLRASHTPYRLKAL